MTGAKYMEPSGGLGHRDRHPDGPVPDPRLRTAGCTLAVIAAVPFPVSLLAAGREVAFPRGCDRKRGVGFGGAHG